MPTASTDVATLGETNSSLSPGGPDLSSVGDPVTSVVSAVSTVASAVTSAVSAVTTAVSASPHYDYEWPSGQNDSDDRLVSDRSCYCRHMEN